ncbi:formate dehydrogenase (acceptor) [Candidatus Hakubella thermalkaliphila]|uniref:Formate dehydrogenase (Acceptor) n=3 Tax=Candidatus Hakubella thermalkaliphila TaxID=2754717 RepID=A0A6V8PZL3_9ACTN|nr:Formate dehydrogenase H [Actinomycetota bacterium]GFP36526.1 formate dehydrogenase (acceptor) [Candidatus Hakubella thermalkaliphila]GFP38740.1 formate dehydrogenase (acceptor) [Candidatus Hakubella thermalkaliphila]GFP41412.1 formate dehydrogenase (acceptor) [Candidatus Hakubella thermalkaliphila]
MEKDRKFRGREWEFETTQTICSLCGCDCDLLLDTMNNHIVRARPEKREGYLCVKGKFGWDYVLNDERLRTPLIRKNGSLTECSWKEALEYVAERLGEIKVTRGPDALGGLISASYNNETLYLFAKFVSACLGTNNIDSSARLFGFPALSDFIHSWGSAGAVSAMSEIEEADTLLVLGSDVMVSSPAVGVKIKKALSRGAKVITIDPRRTRRARLSQLHLQLKVGSEAALLQDMIRLLLKEGLYDKEFVARNCPNFEEFSQSFLEEEAEDRTGVSREDLVEAARLYAEKGKKAIIIFSSEIGDPQLISMIADLLMLTGRVEGGAFPCLPLSNLRGASEVGALAEFYPGYGEVEDVDMRKEFEKRWGVSLSTKAGLTAVEMIEAAGSSLFGLYIVGENPVVSFPDTTRMVKGLSSLEFLVVQDIFLTETAQLADVVLPGISFVESSGTLTNAAGRTERLNKAIEPLTRPDWQVIAELSSRMGYPMKYRSETEVAKEKKALVKGSLEPRKYRFELKELDSGLESVSEEPDREYPYMLMTGATLFSLGDNFRTRRSKISLLESPGDGYIGMSPEDAQSLGATDGTRVSIWSRRGNISSTVKVQEDLPAGLVFMPTHSLGYNILTSLSLDCSTRSPRFRLWAVRIEKEQP